MNTHHTPAGSTPAPNTSYVDGSFEEIVLVTASRIVITDAFAQQDGSAVVVVAGEFRYVKFRTGPRSTDLMGRRIADLKPERIHIREVESEFGQHVPNRYDD